MSSQNRASAPETSSDQQILEVTGLTPQFLQIKSPSREEEETDILTGFTGLDFTVDAKIY